MKRQNEVRLMKTHSYHIIIALSFQWASTLNDDVIDTAHINRANCVHVDPKLAVFLSLGRSGHSGPRRQPCTISIHPSAWALWSSWWSGRIGEEGEKMRRKRFITNSNVPNYCSINKALISINCFHIVSIFTSSSSSSLLLLVLCGSSTLCKDFSKTFDGYA